MKAQLVSTRRATNNARAVRDKARRTRAKGDVLYCLDMLLRTVLLAAGLSIALAALSPLLAGASAATCAGNTAIRPAKADAASPAVNRDMIRLHILANSDTDEDQRIKLCVRDAVRDAAAQLCAGASNADEAYARLAAAGERLAAIAGAAAAREGFRGGASVELGVFPFPDREYAGEIVPAGDYRAVRVLIGEGEGRNWWCVLYPELCFVDEACAEAAAEYRITFYSSIARFFARLFNRGEDIS